MPVPWPRDSSAASVIAKMRRMLRWCERLAFLVIAALGMVVAAFACGGDGEQFDDGAEQPAEEATASPPVQVSPSPGGDVAIEPVDVVPLPPGQTTSSDITLVSVEKWDGTPWFAPDGERYAIKGADRITISDPVTSSAVDLPAAGQAIYWMPDSQSIVVPHYATTRNADEEVAELTTTVDPRRWGSYAWWSRDVLLYSDLAPGGPGDYPRILSFDMKSGTKTQLVSTNRRGAYANLTPTSSGGWLLYAYRDKGTGVELAALYEAVNLYSGQQSALFRWGLGLDFDERTSEIRFLRSVGSPEDMGGWVATVNY